MCFPQNDSFMVLWCALRYDPNVGVSTVVLSGVAAFLQSQMEAYPTTIVSWPGIFEHFAHNPKSYFLQRLKSAALYTNCPQIYLFEIFHDFNETNYFSTF